MTGVRRDAARSRRLLVVHPSPDVYGSDLQLVETVLGAVSQGSEVVVVLPSDGPLVPRLEAAGATVRILSFPVLRKSIFSLAGIARLAVVLPRFFVRGMWLCHRLCPDRILVNTITIPWWLCVGTLTRTPAICHVHEAEADQPRVVRWALALPLWFATRVIANSATTAALLVETIPRLRSRISVVYNGVRAPVRVSAPRRRGPDDELRLVVVSRLSPRKGVDVALEAVARLRTSGCDARIRVCGSAVPGNEWFEGRLRARSSESDLCGAVEFLGYVTHPEVELEKADVALVPSFGESFGNAAAEALLSQRPLVASRVQGLAEIVTDGLTGLLVSAGDAASLVEAIRRLADDPEEAAAMAHRGRVDASARFSVERYRDEMAAQVLN